MRIFILLNLLGLSYCFTVTPPENQWAVVGQNLTIQCKSTEPITSCTWTTPYDSTYTLTHGLKTEGGRIEYFARDNNLVCGLAISDVREKDAGLWECNVGVANKESEVTYTKARATVTMATKPDSISLDKPFDQGTANVSDEWKEEHVKCIVKNANPKPEFSWFIGDEELTDYKIIEEMAEDKTSYSQTLTYSPLASHANKTLRCVVEHVGLDETDSKEASVMLRFTEVSEDFLKEIQELEDLKDAPMEGNFTFVAVGIVLALVFMIFVMMGAFKIKQKLMREVSTEVDVESNSTVDEVKKPLDEEDSNKKEDASNETKEEETKEDKEEEEQELKTKVGLKVRFASFFAFNKKHPADETINQSEKANDEFEKVDLEKVEEGEEKEEDEKDSVKEEQEKPSRVRNFFKLFTFTNRNHGNKEEIVLKESDTEEKQKKDEEEKEKKEEYEPEEKEEIKNKVISEEEEKTEPKNTDV